MPDQASAALQTLRQLWRPRARAGRGRAERAASARGRRERSRRRGCFSRGAAAEAPLAWGVVVSVVAVVSGLVFWLLQPRILDARVVDRRWTHRIVVERYQIVAGEGFAENQPANAFDVVNAGQRHHHDDRVQDGSEQESYSENVACGEDCSTTSVTCTSNDNGFKSCSGGDRVCSTRYCSETRYRDVPHYKTVPVSATWFSWRAWQWADAREVVDQGKDVRPVGRRTTASCSTPTVARASTSASVGRPSIRSNSKARTTLATRTGRATWPNFGAPARQPQENPPGPWRNDHAAAGALSNPSERSARSPAFRTRPVACSIRYRAV